MPIGTWLCLDEFGSRDHECRAFLDFLDETNMKFELIAESPLPGPWHFAASRNSTRADAQRGTDYAIVSTSLLTIGTSSCARNRPGKAKMRRNPSTS